MGLSTYMVISTTSQDFSCLLTARLEVRRVGGWVCMCVVCQVGWRIGWPIAWLSAWYVDRLFELLICWLVGWFACMLLFGGSLVLEGWPFSCLLTCLLGLLIGRSVGWMSGRIGWLVG